MTKREFLDIVFALAPNEANKIMDAFDEYVESNEPRWIPVTERLPEKDGRYLVTNSRIGAWMIDIDLFLIGNNRWRDNQGVTAWMPLPKYYKGVTT